MSAKLILDEFLIEARNENHLDQVNGVAQTKIGGHGIQNEFLKERKQVSHLLVAFGIGHHLYL